MMNAQLRQCQEPNNPDIVRGVLAAMFAATSFSGRKLEERLDDQECCYVDALQLITMEGLVAYVGMTIFEAMTVVGEVFPPEAQEPQAAVALPLVTADVTSSTNGAAEFPELGADGVHGSSSQDMRERPSVFQARLAGRVSQVALTEPAALAGDAKCTIPDQCTLHANSSRGNKRGAR